MPVELDDIDRAILRRLQKQGRLANNELADAVGLSPSPCLRRVRLLEEKGVIKDYVARVDAGKIGLQMTLFTRVWLARQDEETINLFIRAVKDLPEVIECHLMVGDCDFLLKVLVEDLESYRRFQVLHLGRIVGVQQIKTDIPLQTIKSSNEVPL